MPQVSIVIPTYNRAFCIRRAVESVLNQTFSDFELIIVDDGSTDDTPQALRKFSNCIRYIRQQNSGVCAARNTGIENSKGEWVAFLDSDDEWLPNKLEIQINDLKQDPDSCLHTTNAFLVDEDGGQSNLFNVTGCSGQFGEIRKINRPLQYQIRYGLARIQCLMARRDVILSAGLFRPDHPLPLYEDQDLACRLALKGPWIVREKELVRIMRRKEEQDNLSLLRTEESVRSVETLVQIYGRLLGENGLNEDERRLVCRTLNGYEGMLGMRLLESGNQQEAKKVFIKAFRTQPSARLIAKCALALLPLGIAPMLAKQWNLHRG